MNKVGCMVIVLVLLTPATSWGVAALLACDSSGTGCTCVGGVDAGDSCTTDANCSGGTCNHGWVMDDIYSPTLASQDATFTVSGGTNRILVVYLAAEDSSGGNVHDQISHVQFGNSMITLHTIGSAGTGTSYSNMNFFGYLLDNDIHSTSIG